MKRRRLSSGVSIRQGLRGSTLSAACAPSQNGAEQVRNRAEGAVPGPCRSWLRVGARRPSGRPGPRWLRVDLKPLSTGRPGPSRSRTIRPSRDVPSPQRGHWAWLPVVVRRCGTPPLTQRRFGDRAEVPRSDVRWWTRPNLPAPCRRLSTAPRPAEFPLHPWSAGEDTQVVRRGGGPLWETSAPGDHSPGRTKTVRPPTTVRRQTGRSVPGLRSGRPGVPERGSVDQRATRSSGAWTTSSPVRHTA